MKTYSLSRNRWLIMVVVLLCALGLSIAPVSAQAQPIAVGENKTSEVTEAIPTADFTLTVPTPQTARVLVLAITPGFAPSFTVTDPTTGIPLAIVGVEGVATTIQGDVTLAAGVAYSIQIQSGNGVFGQFLLSVQAGPAVQPPTPLTAGQPLSDQVNAGGAPKQYSFTADPAQILMLNVRSDNPAAGPQVTLRDGDLGQTLAVSSARLLGTRFVLPPGAQNYVVDVGHGGSIADEAYTICLEVENGAAPCPGSGVAVAVAPAETPEPTEPPLPTQPNFTAIAIPANGPCSVAPVGGSPINVRSGPSTSFSIVTQLAPNTIVPVIGRTADNSWYQVNASGIIGWVSATVVRIGGNNCGSITVIGAPTPSLQATTTATATPSATTNATATPSATTGSGGGILPPIQGLTLVAPIQVQPVAPRLDYTANPNYGEANLSAGFTPDPYSVGMTSGGDVDVSYLGGGCSGFSTSSPDLRVNFGGGGASLLRFYFVGSSGDTTMVVNDPYGNFYCVDDSFGSVNPTIDFNNPSGGSYDIWIGSYASGTFVSGTLYVTELSGNHP